MSPPSEMETQSLKLKMLSDWLNAEKYGQPAWCFYNNDPTNRTKYGKLYNWHAVNDPRGLAPQGYHIPSDVEWVKLLGALGAEAGNSMKSAEWLEYKEKTRSNKRF